MKNSITALAFLLATPLAIRAEVTKEDLRKLCAAGISDATILTYVRANPPLRTLTAIDLVDLRRAGASDILLSSLLGLATGTASPGEELTPAPAVSEVYTVPASDQSTVSYDSCYPADSCVLVPSTVCFPSFGLGLDLCGGLYSGCYYGTRCYRGYGRYGGYGGVYAPYRYESYHGYPGYYARPHPAPTYGGGTSGGVGPYRGHIGTGSWLGGHNTGHVAAGPVLGHFSGSHPSVGSVHSFSGSSHFGGGSHTFGGGGHSSGGHGGGGHGGHR